MKSKNQPKRSQGSNFLQLIIVLATLLTLFLYLRYFSETQIPLDHNIFQTKNLETKQSNFQNANEKIPSTNPPSISNDLRLNQIKPKETIESPKKLKIAFAITITKDGNFQDGAAVLAYSIYKTGMTKEFDVSLVAFVHPNVTSSRPILRNIGFHVIESPTPINTHAIKFEFLREKINKNGCCGAAELIKLNSYRLLAYDWVVHMDADTFFLQSISELFLLNKSLVYTTDPNMATFKMAHKMPAQGGFLLLRPSQDDYLNMIDIMLTTDFVLGQGWNRSQIGWFYGGMTIQGLLPYYYNKVTAPDRSVKVDRCIYNTMADTEECLLVKLENIKTAHFTVCQKPWLCIKRGFADLCLQLHREWMKMREEAQEFYSLPSSKACQRRYIPLRLEDAKIHDFIENPFLTDFSPDKLLPIGNNGFPKDHKF